MLQVLPPKLQMKLPFGLGKINMSESNLSPEELHNVELEIPAFQRKDKLRASRILSKRLENPGYAGGTKSLLDPINPHKLKEFGDPTVPLKKADIKEPSRN